MQRTFSDKRIHVVSDLGEPVGSFWKEMQTQPSEDEFIVASPISNTPLPIYTWVIEHASEFKNWKKFQFLLMDEQVSREKHNAKYVLDTDPASFTQKIKNIFLEPLEQKMHFAIPIISPQLTDMNLFDKRLDTHGGIDLLILAIGEEGHYAQVMPGTKEVIGFHISELLESYRRRHHAQGVFQHGVFQEYGMSLGPQQVLGAKQVIVIISGKQKQSLTQQLFSYRSFDPQFPLSIIFHPKIFDKVNIFLTPEVLSE